MNLKLQLKSGLLYTSIKIEHGGKNIVVNDVIVDTGAFHTIISPDFLEELQAEFTNEDMLIEAYGYGGASSYAVRKRIDTISCGDIKLDDFKIDFGQIDPDEKVNGLLGLDFFREAGIVLDIADLNMYRKR
ncbi:retropepsin-like aspartic protease [uncultured Clostridium sp.]|uniref:retropepsin-like aspartic protease n=1 Tax=uncultured Clostridium sp. TaxID=59620 RepID=UPI0025FBF522|nr:retropepsin-like aspartic protease [uncultured Clostridium sp.]